MGFLAKPNQSIPQCFIEKMDADEALKKLRAFPVIDYDGFKKVFGLQQRARRLCQVNVERRPAGSAGAK